MLRRVALEAGRRLVALDKLEGPEDAVMLTADELRNALRARNDLRALAKRRKAEHAWVRAHPGPMRYGATHRKMPDLRGLPEPARRINSALHWIMDQELSVPNGKSSNATTMTGVAASPGVYRGVVRVIGSANDLGKLRSGEVLVCPIAMADWMMVLQRAGALVTDAGSALSNTAIVAREYRLPAVVSTANATSQLVDGEEVVVDGNRGIVERSTRAHLEAKLE